MTGVHRWGILLALAVWVGCALPGLARRAQAQGGGYLQAQGGRILDANGNLVIVSGISWFGMETENYAPHGLWARSLDSFLDQIAALGFNTIRLPYSNQLLDPTSQPNGINYDLNPDLKGLNGLEILDRVIAGAGARGLKVILDRHRPDSRGQSELWYTPQYNEERWIGDWVMLAQRYAGDDTVIGADLHNEPHGRATWGSGDPATDWRLAAERAGNAILAVNPNWLIIVQGVQEYQGDSYWWGGNLIGAREHPVRLSIPGRLVYSPHTYGPGVYPQPWFADPRFPENMPEIWDRHWGYLSREGIAPVMVGEFGGRSVRNDKEGIWQRALVAYLKENQISYVYWSLNPNSGDTGGILLDDWQSVDPEKEALLASYQFPLIGSGAGVEAATATPPTATPGETAPPPIAAPATSAAAPSDRLRVRNRTSQQSDSDIDAKPEFIIANLGQAAARWEELELVYWFQDDPGQTHQFACDWAQIGCENITGAFDTLGEGNYALRLRFSPGLTPLPPGQESGEIKLRFNRADWSAFRQADDYSFAAVSEYTDWDRVAVYADGRLIWGSEPGPAPATSATATASPAPTRPEATAAAAAPPEAAKAPAWGVVILVAAAFAAGALLAVGVLLKKSDR
jgi:endoglucanase